VAVTAGPARPRWTILLRPRWLAWHLFAVLATVGMFWLGDWQLHRAEGGNELSWAYTFEWPLFAIFGVYFWAKSLRDELRSEANSGVTAAAGQTGATGDPADTAPGPATQAAAADTAAAAAAYVERLKAEVGRHGKWHGLR
jgi:hypothetical protein